MEARVRWLRGSGEVHTAQSHASDGTPNDVPVPSIVTRIGRLPRPTVQRVSVGRGLHVEPDDRGAADPLEYRLIADQLPRAVADGAHHGQPVADLLPAIAALALDLLGCDRRNI